MSVVSATPLSGYDHHKQSSSSPLLNKKLNSYPKIEHPSKRTDNNNKTDLDIRGRSRDGHGDGKLIRNESSRSESINRHRRSSSFKHNLNTRKYSQHNDDMQTIYEQVQDQVRLPIFGHRTDSQLSSSSSYDYDKDKEKQNHRTSRIQIDELEVKLREKVRSQLHDVRTKFRHAAQNDPNGKISRQALQHLIATVFGTQTQIAPNQIEKLLERLDLKYLNKISFDEFLQSLFNGEEQLPDWINRDKSPREESSSRKSATQMFLILKERIRTKHKDLLNICPSLNGGPSSRIFKAQFHNAINDMGYKMKDTEFDKLWDKFDTDGFKAVNSDKFTKILTNESIGEEEIKLSNNDESSFHSSSRTAQSSHSESDLKTPRLIHSRGQLDENQIQKWLNYKFPQGLSDLERSLERLDTKQMGTLPRDRFLEELKRFGLKLETNLLEFFLKRLNVDLSLTNDGIPYHDVINAFKQKSDPTRKRINADNQVPAEDTRQTSLEKQIDYALSMNYEQVRDLFYNFDVSNSGTVSANELRSIIEDFINYILKPDEYHQLLKQIPMDENRRVKYKEYLKQVLDRTLHLQEQEQQKSSKNSQWDSTKEKTIRQKLNLQELKQKRQNYLNQTLNNNNNNNSDDNEQQQRTRSIDELCEMLKSLIRNRYKDIEDEFKKLDRGSYRELTQDLLFDLFKRLSLKPEVTRSEIDLIWSRCHLKENGHLDFYQFLREFGYSKRSAHYPNAKKNPPKRGDADFLLTSRKLYGDSILVHGTALNAIRSNWNELRREFAELDPYRTGYVQSDEFDEILTELCPSVNQDDLDIFKFKFQTQNDSRMNYVRFLKHHAPLPELIGVVEESNRNYPLPTINERSPRATSDRSILTQVCNKLSRKLIDSYKQLRRTFKQRDPTNSGSVPVKAFKEILNQYKCSLNDEEFYTLTSQIDTKMDGTIDYNYFLQQYVKSN
ncbi:unnamed protein product [Rotaria magnacalcarata]|uniref:EF-hand domain-containing protein n=1 Tax=Rotaria magnacalcarata TaxID=392030 RepID=A0A816WYX1_9BILA|nr:unnamed protein product [Rotaria magnacalcarata]CAF2143649.1 unnamed protein product [Rotaria magnacalcarata]CAF4041718.1 unnamed protein product [Rotaria magnacalcarata]CAF4054239.1 unnamed protein product [Rotaria magnacalcarata]